MRGAALMAIFVVLLFPLGSALSPIQPALMLTLEPTAVTVNSLPDAKVTVNFNGTVRVDKLPLERIVVTLIPEVDEGWPCNLSPTSMVVTDEQPHPFTCIVTVPENTQNVSATLKVEGTGRGGGFVVTALAQSTINVFWYPPANWTGGTAGTNTTGGTSGTGSAGTNQTIPGGNQSSTGGPFRLGPLDMTGLAVLVVVLAVAASGAYWIRRRKLRRQNDESADAPVEEVEAL